MNALTMNNLGEGILVHIDIGLTLAVQRQDSGTAVSTDYWHTEGLGISATADGLRNKGRCTHNIECRNAKETRRIKCASFFQDFSGHRDGRINRVGNYTADRLRAGVCHLGEDVVYNGCVGLQLL